MSKDENLNFDPLKSISNADENLANKVKNENTNFDKENL